MPKTNPHDKDSRVAYHVTGSYQHVPRHPDSLYANTTLAAGAVLWRGDVADPASIEVAVIHRPHYDDWSLAKGKVDPGESLPVTVAREVAEETGLRIRMGSLLGHVTYPVSGRTKVVFYWTAEVLDGEFTTNDEVDELVWLSFDDARARLSYDVDAEVLTQAQQRLQVAPTARLLLIRHARAHDRGKWEGDDHLRPLDKKGRRQAEMLVPMLLPFEPSRVLSATPDRCQHTAAPLADELGVEVIIDEKLDDATWISSPETTQARIQELIAEGGITALVSQGTAIPGIVEWLADDSDVELPEDVKAKKGSVWMLTFTGDRLRSADYLASALPVK